METIYEAQATKIAEEENAQQAETTSNLKNIHEEGANNPLADKKKTKEKKSLKDNTVRLRKIQTERLEVPLKEPKELNDLAEQFAKGNREFRQETLLLLADKVKDCKTKEELLETLSIFFADPTTADEALDFLLEATKPPLQDLVAEAKELHNKEHGREIAAGKNIQKEVFEATDQKLGAPTTLRDLYRDITGNPRDPVALFAELANRFQYKQLRKVLAFLFHSLGSDLKAQGPSTPPGLLYRLLSEVRSLQAILGVFQFFKKRMSLIKTLFQKNGLTMPNKLNFEQLAKEFVNLLQERYPTGDKALLSAKRLGIDDWILAKIIVFSQLRDAIRAVSLHKMYRSIEHRDELYNALLEALESLEDELEELLEEEYEEEDDDEEIEES